MQSGGLNSALKPDRFQSMKQFNRWRIPLDSSFTAKLPLRVFCGLFFFVCVFVLFFKKKGRKEKKIQKTLITSNKKNHTTSKESQ